MNKTLPIPFLLAVALAISSLTGCDSTTNSEQAEAVSVTSENYSFAMLDMAMKKEFDLGADNSNWHHHRTPIQLDEQPAPMMNRDTLYSFSMLDARGDIEITLPESNGRYMSLQVMNHDHVTYKVFYGAGVYKIPADKTSDYIMANVRIQINASDLEDVKQANALQDQYKIRHMNGYKPEPFQVTNWNMNEFSAIHKQYTVIANKNGVLGTMGTTEKPVSTEDRNRGVSIATGLLPDKDAVYLSAKYEMDKNKVYKATYTIPEQVDAKLGFYSITIYGDDQYLHDDEGATISNQDIKNNPDGKTFDVYYVSKEKFGTYDNELIVPTDTFNITMRVYLPSESVQAGEYKLPVPQEIADVMDTGVGKNGVVLASNPSFIAEGGEKVTMENVVRAETAKYFAEETIISGPNKFRHERKGIQLDNQTIIRSNFDTIYSYSVFDASKGLSVTVPPYELYHSVQIFDENHVTLKVVYPGETGTIDPKQLTYGDHVYLFMRTQPPSTDEAGMKLLHERQNSVVVKAGSAKPYVSEVKYDVDSFNKLRNDLIARAPKETVIHKGFIEDIKDIEAPYYQMTNLAGWAGLPARHAHYFVVLPGDEGAAKGQPASMTFKDPDLQYGRSGYWSLTIYDQAGWVVTDTFKISSLEAKPNSDGTYTIHFNAKDGAINNLQAPENWNALFRNYLPESKESILQFEGNIKQKSKPLSLTK